jgi:hypothetical protein
MNAKCLRFWILCLGLMLFLAQAEGQSIPYERCPWVSEELWEDLKPYFVPEDSPLKAALDKIFWKIRATASPEMMKKAGFIRIPMEHKRKNVVFHPALKGYLIKTYLDHHNIATEDWRLWLHRIKGARQIQAFIDKQGLGKNFKAPKKWLYPLPPRPEPKTGFKCYPRNFILVVEDQRILPIEMNERKYWKIKKAQLDGLYKIVHENLLHDSIYLHNIPFCEDGRITFLDTEHFNSTRRRVRYERLLPYLRPEMQTYWETLILQGKVK